MDVDPHAICRFRERTGCKQTDEYIEGKLLEIAERASPATFSNPKHAVLSLLNHDCKPASYLIAQCGFVMVVVDDRIKTVHMNESKRWVKR